MSVDDPYVGFEVSPRAKEIYQNLRAFMEAHVYPNEGRFHDEVETGERWQPTALMEELMGRSVHFSWARPTPTRRSTGSSR